jgi:Rrf2 family protein
MKISTRSRYGLRLLIELANQGKAGKPVFLNEIARNQDISEKYLSKLVIPLRGAGIIQSARGAHGGYLLKRDASEINLKQIIDALEGGLSILDCTENPRICPRHEGCSARDVWGNLEKVMSDYCEAQSLAKIAEAGNARDSVYYI